MKHDLFELFVDKIFNITCPIVQRFVYNTRDIIRKENLPLEQICKISIGYLIEILDTMNKVSNTISICIIVLKLISLICTSVIYIIQDIAIITFQILCHVLQNFMPDGNNSQFHEKSDHRKKFILKSILEGDPIVEAPILLTAILDGLMVISEKFKLSWQECVETISLLSLVEGILNHTGVSSLVRILIFLS